MSLRKGRLRSVQRHTADQDNAAQRSSANACPCWAGDFPSHALPFPHALPYGMPYALGGEGIGACNFIHSPAYQGEICVTRITQIQRAKPLTNAPTESLSCDWVKGHSPAFERVRMPQIFPQVFPLCRLVP